MKNLKVAAMILLSAMVASSAWARPTWCANARTLTEIAICKDTTLSQLDVQMDATYKYTQRIITPFCRQDLLETQRIWLASRNLCGASVPCLDRAYRDRQYQIELYPARTSCMRPN